MSAAPPVNRPADLPDLRLWLVEQWRKGGPLEAVAQLLRHDSPHSQISHLEPRFDRRVLREAALWWVSADMVDLLNHAAPALDDVTLTYDMVPDEAALCVFEKPLIGIDSQTPDHTVRVNAILWGPSHLPPLPPMHPWPEEGVGIASYRHHRAEEGFAADEMQLAIVTGMVFQANARQVDESSFMLEGDLWVPIGRSDWIYGEHISTPVMEGLPAHQHESMAEDRRWLAALWLLASQKNLSTERTEVPSRPVRRRTERAGMSSATVRIIDLRHQREHAGPTGHRDVEWKHRWIVGAHWRNQAVGPGRKDHRPVWIAPYAKGPADKPLVIRPTVKVVR